MKDATNLSMRTRLLSERPSWTDLKKMAKQLSDFLYTVAIPFEDRYIHTGYSDRPHDQQTFFKTAFPDARQMRYQRTRDLQEIIRQSTEGENGNPAMNVFLRTKATNFLQEIVTDITNLAELDSDPVYYTPFRESGMGRAILANDFRRDDGKPDTLEQFKLKVAREFSRHMPEYLARSFPDAENNGQPLELNVRTLILVARDLFDGLTNDDPQESGEAIHTMLMGAERNGIFQIPEIDNVRTPAYFQDLIRNKFSDQAHAPSLDYLLPFTVQDRLQAKDAVKALAEQKNSRISMNDLTLYYMTGDQRDKHELLSLGRDKDNRVMVMPDNDGEPILIQSYGDNFRNLLRVVKPGYQEKIVDTMEDGIRDPMKRLDYRTDAINHAVGEMTRMTENATDNETLRALESEWKAMFTKGEVSGGKIQKFQQKVAEATEFLVTPQMHKLAVNPESAQVKLEHWWSLATRSGLSQVEDAVLKFGLPRHLGRMMSGQQPDAEIERENGSTEMKVYRLDKDMNRLESVTVDQGESNIALAIETARSWNSHFLGKPNKAVGAGMEIGATNNDGKFVGIGHWLSPAEREALTVVPLADIRSRISAPIHEARSGAGISQVREQVLAMIFQPSMDDPTCPQNRGMIEANYHWNINNVLELESQSGERYILPISNDVLATETFEDIRRHVAAQIATSPMPHYEKQDAIHNVRTTNMDKAASDYSVALDELGMEDEEELETMRVG
ncbi:hypothetical protein [Marinobacter salarius]|nr:hypothetical protein [Marinobacter salarius]